MLAVAAISGLAFSGPSLARSGARVARSSPMMETKADLESLAKELNPVVGFYDPMGLADADFFGQGEAAQIGFLREAEIKHGRVAMAGFVGYIVHANGIRFPWAQTLDGMPYPDASLSPPEAWDAIPQAAKLQIILFIGFLEFWNECKGTHYMRGGKPGDFPSLKEGDFNVPHPIPFDLFDPFGFSKNASPEKKKAGLVKEINNGRLAMLGLIGFLTEAKLPGSVPALSSIVKPYSGEVMAPFAANFHFTDVFSSL